MHAKMMMEEERLLDRYPLSEEELRRLLKCSDRSSLDKIVADTVIVDASAPRHWDHSGDDPGAGDRQEALENEDRPLDEHDGALPHDGEAEGGLREGGLLLLSALPELSDIYRRALAKVFVVPSCATENKGEEAASAMELETCLEAICTLLGRRGAGNGQQFLWDVLFDAFQHGGGSCNGDSFSSRDRPVDEPAETAADRDGIMTFLYRVAMVAMASTSPQWNKVVPLHGDTQAAVPEGWIQSLSPGKSTVSRTEWDAWTAGNYLYRCVSTVFHRVLQFQPRLPPLEFPPPTLFPSPLEAVAMAAMGAFGNNGKYHPDLLLYDSDRDGLSFRVLQQALIGFFGPTMLIVRTTANDCWGYRTSLPWKSSRTWYTSSDEGGATNSDDDSCYLFRLSPKWNRYRMIPSTSASLSSPTSSSSSCRRKSPYHQYLNVEACHQPQNRALKGLAVGGVGGVYPSHPPATVPDRHPRELPVLPRGPALRGGPAAVGRQWYVL
jgi:TLD